LSKAYIVTGLGWGDEGKGCTVDMICRHTGADLVVRHNGGAQAAHNVVLPDGRHHTFAQLGSASFVPGTRTFLSQYMLVNPWTLLVEKDRFEEQAPSLVGRIFADARAPITLPYHVFLNRSRENARGVAKHGTTGAGISETVLDHMARPGEAMVVGDLRADRSEILRKVLETKDALMSEMARLGACDDFERMDPERIVDHFMEFRDETTITDEDGSRKLLQGAEKGIVFEGAQGVLLDENYGFHPHTTWSTTTPANAIGLIKDNKVDMDYEVVGVTRTYGTRHGAGPFPTESFDLHYPEEHNGNDGMAGQFRQGYLDIGLLVYACNCCEEAVDGVVVNYVDIQPGKYCRYNSHLRVSGLPSTTRDQEALTRQAWSPVDPEDLKDTPKGGIEHVIAEALQVRLMATGSGPTYRDKQIIDL